VRRMRNFEIGEVALVRDDAAILYTGCDDTEWRSNDEVIRIAHLG